MLVAETLGLSTLLPFIITHREALEANGRCVLTEFPSFLLHVITLDAPF